MSQEQREAYLSMKRQYSKDNRVMKSAYKKRHYAKNKEKTREVQRNWRSRNKDKLAVWRKKWLSKEENRIRLRNHAKARESKKKATREEKREISKWELEWKSKEACTCVFCLKDIPSKYGEVEHFYCLSGGGSHHIRNLSISCRDCNAQKYAKDPFLFIKEVVYSDYDTLYENN